MWGFGGRYYWGRKERAGKVEGIVVVFAWMSSHERQLKSYSDLYSSLGWNSLICHSQFLNMFFPEKATSLATDILDELVQELKINRVPVVFASFSGGPKACMAKVLQIIEGVCEEPKMSDYQLVKDCICGHIYDSSPVDFTSDLGTRFILHPTVMKMPQPPRVVSWLVNGIASSLDALFLSRFEQQRADYWQILHSTVSLKAPYLLLCSENDDLAPYQTIVNFAQRLQELGADVKMVKWNGSPHVGHYKHHKVEYEAAITELLSKASEIYSQRTRGISSYADNASRDGIIEPTKSAQRMKALSSNGFQGMSLATGSDDLFLPSSTTQYYEGREVQREDMIRRISYPPRINAHGVLGQVLFDICVPKDVEDWDVVHSSTNRRGAGRRNAHFNPIKCIRRSRL